MHVIAFLYRKSRGNKIDSAGQETYANLCAFVLPWVPTNIHKIIKNTNCNFASHKYKNDYLFGRHASNGSLHREDKYVSRHSNLLVTTSGFCDELEKVSFDTSAGDRIFGAKN